MIFTDGIDQLGARYHKIYFLSTHMKASWINAQSFCHSLNMELASFETKDEADWFSDIFRASRQDVEPGFCYIGGIRIFNDAELSKENWYWVNSGRKINYGLTWAPQEPSGTQWCLCLSKNTAKTVEYFDIHCHNRDENFICQKNSLSANS